MSDRPIVRAASIHTFLLKIASRCNINCAYCFEYNLADSSWRRKPPKMSTVAILTAIRRIDEHIVSHGLKSINVIFHGGEPLLGGRQLISEVIEQCNEVIGDKCRIHYGLQTNGMLLDHEWLDFFLAHRNQRRFEY